MQALDQKAIKQECQPEYTDETKHLAQAADRLEVGQMEQDSKIFHCQQALLQARLRQFELQRQGERSLPKPAITVADDPRAE
jgi:hypothetical protein